MINFTLGIWQNCSTNMGGRLPKSWYATSPLKCLEAAVARPMKSGEKGLESWNQSAISSTTSQHALGPKLPILMRMGSPPGLGQR